jgi:NUMOD4 motif.
LDDMYEVSNLGRVRSLPRLQYCTRGNGYWFRTKGTILKPTMMGSINRYPYVRISTDKVNKPMPIHRFVVESFIGEIPEGMVVNHIDGNTSNNNVINLEIVTYTGNFIHSRDVLKTPRGYSKSKLKITNCKTGESKIYNDGVEVSKDLGCCSENIRLYARGIWKGLYLDKYKIEEAS